VLIIVGNAAGVKKALVPLKKLALRTAARYNDAIIDP
jgi:hypothetical protein